jgi:hypothetical protein
LTEADDDGTMRRVNPTRRLLVVALGMTALWSLACAEGKRDTPTTDRPAAVSPAGTNETVAPTAEDGPRVVRYAPGIRIDFRVPQVEVDASVILNSGMLELFAYSKAPVPKEHESVLYLDVPAERIFEALGLIGLKPGSPPRYDPETKKVFAATGEPVDVRVRYEDNGESREVSACDWMIDMATEQPMQPTHWLFTGSVRNERGVFGANVEGTVVTVVDFTTSLLNLPETHSDSDEMLWLAANPDRIPPPGSDVTLILRPVASGSDAAPD